MSNEEPSFKEPSQAVVGALAESASEDTSEQKIVGNHSASTFSARQLEQIKSMMEEAMVELLVSLKTAATKQGFTIPSANLTLPSDSQDGQSATVRATPKVRPQNNLSQSATSESQVPERTRTGRISLSSPSFSSSSDDQRNLPHVPRSIPTPAGGGQSTTLLMSAISWFASDLDEERWARAAELGLPFIPRGMESFDMRAILMAVPPSEQLQSSTFFEVAAAPPVRKRLPPGHPGLGLYISRNLQRELRATPPPSRRKLLDCVLDLIAKEYAGHIDFFIPIHVNVMESLEWCAFVAKWCNKLARENIGDRILGPELMLSRLHDRFIRPCGSTTNWTIKTFEFLACLPLIGYQYSDWKDPQRFALDLHRLEPGLPLCTSLRSFLSKYTETQGRLKKNDIEIIKPWIDEEDTQRPAPRRRRKAPHRRKEDSKEGRDIRILMTLAQGEPLLVIPITVGRRPKEVTLRGYMSSAALTSVIAQSKVPRECSIVPTKDRLWNLVGDKIPTVGEVNILVATDPSRVVMTKVHVIPDSAMPSEKMDMIIGLQLMRGLGFRLVAEGSDRNILDP